MNKSVNITKANILLVDDTPNNLRLLSAMLSDQGYEVRRVVNGQMALKTAQAYPPDLILLDIKMPDMNGYEVCQHLKAISQTQAIPVIFISALDEVLDKVKAFAVGAADYITKPFSEEEVLARVENILTIRQLQQQLQIQSQELQQVRTKYQQLEADLASSQANYQALGMSLHLLLRTERLTLTPILPHELNNLQMILNNPSVRRYLCDDKIFSRDQVEEMLNQSINYFAAEKIGLWLIRINGKSEAIGFVGLWYFFDENQPQLIYALLPEVLKKGYATEAAARILKYCFDELGYEYLVASCDQPNSESQRVAVRLGMQKVEEKNIAGNTVVVFRANKASSLGRIIGL